VLEIVKREGLERKLEKKENEEDGRRERKDGVDK